MRTGFLLLLVLHGLIHFMGFAKAFGYAEIPALTLPISRGQGWLWLVAGLAMLLTAGCLVFAPRLWGAVGLLAVVLSQLAIVSSWGDAKFGTIANILILAGSVIGFAAQGPFSFQAEYERAVHERLARPAQPAVLTEADIQALPEPVRRYLRAVGAVGQSAVHHVRTVWKGRIREKADDPWMNFTAEQVNVIDPPARLFLLKATRSGLPVDVYHAFEDGAATMRVRLLSLFPMVDARGPALTRTETVTVFNDIALLAPSALADPGIQWESIDERSARGVYRLGENTVSAVFTFNEAGELMDFISEDRQASLDGGVLTSIPWSTPIAGYQSFGPRRVMTRGEGKWHPAAGAYTYIDLELVDWQVNPNQ